MTLFDDLNMSGDGTKKLLVWWDNPSHTQIPVQNMDSSSVYWQISHMLSNFKQQYHGYAICKSSNASPLIYARKDYKDQYDAYVGTDIALFKDTFWDEAKVHAVQNSANDTALEGDMLCDQDCQIFNDPVPYEDYG